ncbi:unnamed protein product [Candidula unifasciata]|uniref:Uncharacterized protein n=1 Tax=Candidula unifasciata TaxID=100452 RepID=A0A8S3Z6B6_9EUPU|nr:unnamed protein product [Candidula unifasciata]
MTQIGPNIITFFMSNVGISIWPAWMKSFTNLTELSFEGSTLSSIPDDAFSTMKRLTSLSLDNNHLHEVPLALSGLTTLQSLYLEDNLISNITWLPKSSSLSTLSLGGNKLSNSTHISESLLPYANSLSDIDLEDNQLASIPELDFLAQVDSLDFSKNRLSSATSGTFPAKLDYLDISSNLFSAIPSFILTLQFVPTLALSSNIITGIKDTDFPSCIIFVQLDNNRVTQLTDTSFPVDSGILSLTLDDNPLGTISALAFNNLSNLTHLSLKNSYLTRLPIALSSLKKLTLFDITSSRYLVCTCAEKSLQKWVQTMSAVTLLGDCGLTSISVFFATLSPRCPSVITAATDLRGAANLVASAP